jgi:hypothetical protein
VLLGELSVDMDDQERRIVTQPPTKLAVDDGGDPFGGRVIVVTAEKRVDTVIIDVIVQQRLTAPEE